jgi:choline dehydrogenase-like flavoprotein
MANERPDVVIVGSGVSGSIIALELASAGKRVLILEAGPAVPDDRGDYMNNFYLDVNKRPEAPYPPLTSQPAREAAPRATINGLINYTNSAVSYLVQRQSDYTGKVLPFGSTYERIGGGTTWHWLGTSLRMVPNDLHMYSHYGVFDKGADWPMEYSDLQKLYAQAEAAIGVAASVEEQAPLKDIIGLTYPGGYEYPMQSIPLSMVDQGIAGGLKGFTVDGNPVFVSPTPAGRNSEPYQGRRLCAGNTNCIPICPIQAKWDATVTLHKALDTGKVKIIYQAVVRRVLADAEGKISGLEYVTWDKPVDPQAGSPQVAVGTQYVLAANAIENAKLLLMSTSEQFPKGIANYSDQVGRNLMDHVLYICWGLTAEGKPIFPFRGPLATGGIESLRDGPFRSSRSAYRIEIGNDGWSFPVGDPYITFQDLIDGTNNSALNPITPPGTTNSVPSLRLGGLALAEALNDRVSRQFHLSCLIEQAPRSENRVTADFTHTDGLGLARPKIAFGLDDYALRGFASARATCKELCERIGGTDFTDYSNKKYLSGYFEYEGVSYVSFGAGHLIGTHRMGSDKNISVVDAAQRSHDHPNLWITGSGSFPTCATPNPTLTLAALAFATAAGLKQTLT